VTLAIDIGNTRIKVGLFRENELVQKETWEVLDLRAIKEIAYNQKIQNVILCSVAEVSQTIEASFKEDFHYLQLTEKTPLPIKNLYQTPASLGKDRLAAVVGAYHFQPGKNCLVIDAGSCITFDLLNAKGEYLGGNISPGVEMRLKAMHHFTARLPKVERQQTKSFLGRNTKSALQNGGQLGAVLETKAFIDLCKQNFRTLQILLTGGDADFFAKRLKTKIFVHPNLVLEGLNKIMNYNVGLQE